MRPDKLVTVHLPSSYDLQNEIDEATKGDDQLKKSRQHICALGIEYPVSCEENHSRL
jgi:hypothetical protein